MSLHITTLATEIIEGVVQHLQLADLCMLRLTCKALTEKSSYHFSYTYCTQASTNLSLASIQRLDDRSRSPLAKYVTDFWLRWDEEAGRGLIWDRDASKAIVPDLPVIQQMRDIIIRFSNCRSFCIENNDEIDYYTPASTFSPRTDSIGCSDIVGVGFILIAETGLPLEKFGVYCGGHGGTQAHYRVRTDMIHTEQMRRPAFKTVLSNLRELSLYLLLETGENSCLWPWDLVLLSANLEKLKWNVWTHTYDFFHFNPIRLSYLQELVIHGLCISATNLTEVLLGCRESLRSLTLFHVKLDRDWRSTLQSLQSFDKLESISLQFLKEYDHPAYKPGTFPGLDDTVEVPGSSGRKLQLRKRWQRIVGVEYSGPGTQNVIATLIRHYEPSSI